MSSIKIGEISSRYNQLKIDAQLSKILLPISQYMEGQLNGGDVMNLLSAKIILFQSFSKSFNGIFLKC
jgi:hypothetical protein